MATKKSAQTPAQKVAAATKKFETQKKKAQANLQATQESALNAELQVKQTIQELKTPGQTAAPVVEPTATMGQMPPNFIEEYKKQFQNEYGLDFSGTSYTPPPVSNAKEIFKQLMLSKGYPQDIIDDSLDFIQQVASDMNISFTDTDKMKDVVNIHESLYSYTTKDNKTIYSPFMSKYGDYIKASKQPGVSEPLEGTAVIGYVNAIESAVKQYGLNPVYSSKAEILNYIKNNIDAKTFNARLNEGKAAALTAPEDYVQSLQKQGYISGRNDLLNFYVNPQKGKEIFEQNKISGVIGGEAIRAARETANLSNFNIATIQEAAKRYQAEGFSQEESMRAAKSAYQQVQADIAPTLTASGIYEMRGPDIGKTESGQSLADLGRVGEIQSVLEKEQLLGNMASQERRKKLAKMYEAGLSGSSGTAGSISLAKNIQL